MEPIERYKQLFEAVKRMRELQNIRNPHPMQKRDLTNTEATVDRLIEEIIEAKK